MPKSDAHARLEFQQYVLAPPSESGPPPIPRARRRYTPTQEERRASAARRRRIEDASKRLGRLVGVCCEIRPGMLLVRYRSPFGADRVAYVRPSEPGPEAGLGGPSTSRDQTYEWRWAKTSEKYGTANGEADPLAWRGPRTLSELVEEVCPGTYVFETPKEREGRARQEELLDMIERTPRGKPPAPRPTNEQNEREKAEARWLTARGIAVPSTTHDTEATAKNPRQTTTARSRTGTEGRAGAEERDRNGEGDRPGIGGDRGAAGQRDGGRQAERPRGERQGTGKGDGAATNRPTQRAEPIETATAPAAPRRTRGGRHDPGGRTTAGRRGTDEAGAGRTNRTGEPDRNGGAKATTPAPAGARADAVGVADRATTGGTAKRPCALNGADIGGGERVAWGRVESRT